MEGPSLIILREEAQKFVGKRVLGCATLLKSVDCTRIEKQTLRELSSWGKHFLLSFKPIVYRIHFLMFGSYTVDEPKPEKIPKLSLTFRNGALHFYSCSIQPLPASPDEIYDWRIDIMSERWDENYVLRLVDAQPQAMLCDVMLDQGVFAGSGNIIKNEVLYNLRLHPEARVESLAARKRRTLVRAVRAYGFQFYEWKKAYVLRKNWKVYRRRYCAVCKSPVAMTKTGVLKRVSFVCPQCQASST